MTKEEAERVLERPDDKTFDQIIQAAITITKTIYEVKHDPQNH